MGDLYYFLPQAAFAMPALATLIAGLVLVWVRRDRLAPRAWRLAVAGLGVLLTGALADVAYLGLLPQIVRRGGWQDTQLVLAGVNLLFLVLHTLGMALVIAAILVTAPPKDPWAAHPAPALQPQAAPPAEAGGSGAEPG
jgi:hypothetical protein